MKKIFLVYLFIFQVITSAAVYYTNKNNPSASDNNPGTEQLPFATIQKAVNKAMPGDTVFVKYGIYNEKVMMQRSGQPGAKIVIMAYNSLKPVIDGTGINTAKLVNWGVENKNYIIFKGFEVKNAQQWGVWIEGDFNEIRNCKVHNILRSGISIVSGNNNIIAGNEVFNIGNVELGKLGNSIHIESHPNEGLTANDNIIENNIIYNNASHFGVNVFPEDQQGYPQTPMTGNIIRNNVILSCLGGIYTRYQKNFKIYNNVIARSIDNGIWLHIQSSAPAEQNTFDAYGEIYSNTIYGSGNRGLLNSTSNHLKIKNNLFIDNGDTPTGGQEHIKMDKVEGQEINNNLYYGVGKWKWNNVLCQNLNSWKSTSQQDSQSLDSNPACSNLITFDFALPSFSPAIDKGADLGAPYNVDIRGVSRPQGAGYDIGAFEFSSGIGSLILDLKIFLEGPFKNGQMETNLKSLGLLPQQQPYNTAPWNYNGTETLANMPDDIVDWLLIELRSAVNPSTVITTKACILKNSGVITEADGVTPVSFNLPAGAYYVTVYHRNHLSVMSNVPVLLTSYAEAAYDFTDSMEKYYGTNSAANLGNSCYGMISGDGDASGGINDNDRTAIWQIENGKIGYFPGDYDLSGGVGSTDRNDQWKNNSGKATQVP